MQNQPYVPASESNRNLTAQTVFVVVLAALGLGLMALWPSLQPATVEPTSGAVTVNSEAVNPELRLADRYVAPAVVPEARAAANPELAAHERYSSERAALRATVEAPALRMAASNPELAAQERYVAQQAAVRATVEAPASELGGAARNPQQSLPEFKQSR